MSQSVDLNGRVSTAPRGPLPPVCNPWAQHLHPPAANYDEQAALLAHPEALRGEYDKGHAALVGLQAEFEAGREKLRVEREREDGEKKRWFGMYRRGGLAYRGGEEEKQEEMNVEPVVNGREETRVETTAAGGADERTIGEVGTTHSTKGRDETATGTLTNGHQQPEPAAAEVEMRDTEPLTNGHQETSAEEQQRLALSHVVLDADISRAGINISEATRSTTAHSSVPIWRTGGTADRTRGGNDGNGDGNRKRPNDGNDDRADSGDGDDSPGGRKRQRVSEAHRTAGVLFSCPFRKRNPLKFNIRDFQGCALQGFPGFPLVKRHIKQYHFNETRPLSGFCNSCGRDMGTQGALRAHLSIATDRMCAVNPALSYADPDDGISQVIRDILNERKSDGKINSWASLWHLLFPNDTKIPRPDFIPPTELDELSAEFKTPPSMGKLRHLLHEKLGLVDGVEAIVDVFGKHIDSVFAACRERTCSEAASRRQTHS